MEREQSQMNYQVSKKKAEAQEQKVNIQKTHNRGNEYKQEVELTSLYNAKLQIVGEKDIIPVLFNLQ